MARVRAVYRSGLPTAEPIVPLGLFRNGAFSVSVRAVFLAAFGFFAAVVFLARWSQVVNGQSATISGYSMLPLLGGVILSEVASGQVVARTGRYRWRCSRRWLPRQWISPC